MDRCTVNELKRMEFNGHIRPHTFHDGVTAVAVRYWTELDIVFVGWLVRNHHLTVDKLPLLDHAGKGKYFINSQPVHKHPDKDGKWKSVGIYCVDTKYNADAHIKNLLAALQALRVPNPKFTISFHSR